MSSVLRAWRIARVLLRYRLDTLLDGTAARRWLRLARPLVPGASATVAGLPRGERARLALQELGPIFVKFGQILSTRRDLLPADIADELSLLQGRALGAGLARNSAEFLIEESRDVVGRAELDAFLDDVDVLRDDAERLALRVQRGQSALAAHAAGASTRVG